MENINKDNMSATDLQHLLHQMQRTTSMLEERLSSTITHGSSTGLSSKDFPLFKLQGHFHLCQKNEKHCLKRSPECPEEGSPILIPNISNIDTQSTAEIENELGAAAILQSLTSLVDEGTPPRSNYVNVMRDSVLESAFRAFKRQRFSPWHRLNVTFVDTAGVTEGAVDDGGPTREFLRLLITEIKDSSFFNGPDYNKNLSLVSRSVDNGDYRNLGQMISVALVHGGIKPLFFSRRLYHSIASRPTPPVTLEEVDDRELQEQLQRVITAETLAEARDAIMEASGSLCLLGCSAGLRSLDEKEYFTQQALRAYVEGRTQKALEQFVDGMNAMGLAEKIRSHIEELEPLFVGGPKALQLQDLLDLFSVSFAEPGSNRRRAQNQTVMFWNNWLIEREHDQ
ncbi:G2/M phase-specific E3 ubiquitin-protein ligase-like isoform X2 [Girardinichthys multiradiatus]|uniref:G2/M phase-specific E3 ubiquitin-protein ligase-like isoform X2 n=1 Tax=Girardinichthys multiradiatus TaxID=208333 RepID=UPI001FADA404|nr:G2/M phase-specific E3 ubiquitin-protein ligase-like isoform X2 [Girardinichthys multiradiatus]